MSRVNITSIYITIDRLIVEHNQAELSKLEVWIANSV